MRFLGKRVASPVDDATNVVLEWLTLQLLFVSSRIQITTRRPAVLNEGFIGLVDVPLAVRGCRWSMHDGAATYFNLVTRYDLSNT
jgi:hypothetical protein